MSKELTEQWRNGTLEDGYYYATSFIGWSSTAKEIIHPFFFDKKTGNNIKEVLAPVPTYDQFVELTEKADQFSQTVKKVDKLEKQLSEANAIIKSLKDARSQSVNEYIEKYGV